MFIFSIIILIIFRLCQGVWFCGLLGKKQKTSEEDPPIEPVIAEINNEDKRRITKVSIFFNSFIHCTVVNTVSLVKEKISPNCLPVLTFSMTTSSM